MRIAMTGSTGLVGSRLVELLASQHEIIELREDGGFDVTDGENVCQALAGRFDVVLHLAAFTDVGTAWEQYGQLNGTCFRVNALGAHNVASACADYGLYLIHISTDFVFDGRKTSFYYEEDPTNPIEWYGMAKLMAERAVLNSGCSAAILRIAFPFRAAFSGKLDLVRWILNGLREGTLPPMAFDQIITPTFIDDLAPVVDYFARRRMGGIFHATGSSIITPFNLARKITEVWGFPTEVVRSCSLEDLIRGDARPRQQYLSIANVKLFWLGLAMSDLDTALAEMRRQME